MNAAQLLQDLRARDVRLWVEGAMLRYNGPEEAFTEEVLAALKSSKRKLIACLRMEKASGQAPGQPTPTSLREVEAAEVEAALALDPAIIGGEVLGRDLCEMLGLEALDLDAPEAVPTHPSWSSPALLVRELGLWQRCGLCIPTAATHPNWLRYQTAKKAWRAVRPTSVDVGQLYRDNSPNDPQGFSPSEQ